jgi:formate dehydrogenase iron-sulfur subunit
MPKGVLVDLTRCIGCRGCQIACKSWNERPVVKTVISDSLENPPALSEACYTRIRFEEAEAGANGLPAWSFVKEQCLHCKEPACASACPVGALIKTEAGPVVYDFDKCIGCRYCMVACPFEIPKYEWSKAQQPWVQKCTFCAERQADNLSPACVKTCPTDALLWGEQEELLAEAKRRLATGRYVPHIYGEKEAGGTSWIFISDRPFEEIGFNTKVPQYALPPYTWASLSKIPAEIVVFSAVLGGLAFIRNRGSKGGE